MRDMKIAPARSVRGTLHISGDKSISHRAAIIVALSARANDSAVRIENYATGADCLSTLRCLAQLGIEVSREETSVLIRNPRMCFDQNDNTASQFTQPTAPLDCGNSGTTMRLLAGVLAAQPFANTLSGDESLSARPMRRIIEPLTRMGAHIASRNDHAPLRFSGLANGESLNGIEYSPQVLSAQVKSCVLLAGLFARRRTIVSESGTRTRDHTERLLQHFGASIETAFDARANLYCTTLEGAQLNRLTARDVTVPGDISSAAYFIAAAWLLPNSDLTIENVGLNPTRTAFLRTLKSLTGHSQIETLNAHEECFELRGDVRVRGEANASDKSSSRYEATSSDETLTALRVSMSVASPLTLQGSAVAELIDELPLLAVVGTQLEGGLMIRDAAELRVKESDRIKTTVENLRRMNAQVEEFPDGFHVHGRTQLRGAKIDSFGDHRIAMSFAVAALIAEGETEIRDAECVAVSFPEFFQLIEQVAVR